jgi:hypothetical protein
MTGNLDYTFCLQPGGTVSQTKPSGFLVSGWTAQLGGNMAWNPTTSQWAFSGGQGCGTPSTPRQGTITLKCASSAYLNVFENTLYTAGGAVACSNCCNYNMVFYTPAACGF